MLFNRSNNDNTNDNKRQPLHPIAGIWSGVGELFNNPGTYYVQANYRGNGLANTGLGFMGNPYSRDYASAGQALAAEAALRRNDEQEQNNYQLFNALGRLSKMGGRIGQWAAEKRGELLPNGKLKFENLFSKLGDFGQYGRTNNMINSNDRIV